MGASQDTAAMREAGEAISQAFDTAQGIKKKIEDAATTAFSGWKGNASNSFQRAIGNFNEKIQKQLEILNELREKMGQAQLSYEVTASDTEQAVNAVEALLN